MFSFDFEVGCIPESLIVLVLMLVLSRSAATFHGRVESLSWSPYLEECLTVLEDTNEAPGDALLVGLVKLQLIAAKVARVWAQSGDGKTDEGTRMIGPFVASLNMELAAVRHQAPAHLKTNRMSCFSYPLLQQNRDIP